MFFVFVDVVMEVFVMFLNLEVVSLVVLIVSVFMDLEKFCLSFWIFIFMMCRCFVILD